MNFSVTDSENEHCPGEPLHEDIVPDYSPKCII